jgi:hypothetical protein
VVRRNSDCWLLTPEFCSQNEGTSGDLYENKRMGKVHLLGIRKGARGPRSEAHGVQE